MSNDEVRNSIDLQKQIERERFLTSTLDILLFSIYNPQLENRNPQLATRNPQLIIAFILVDIRWRITI